MLTARDNAAAGHGTDLAPLGQVGLFRRFSWAVVPLTVGVALYNNLVQRWLDFQPPSFPGDALVAPLLGSVLLLAAGPFMPSAVKEARARRPERMLIVVFAMAVGLFALVTSTVSGCGC